jgi:hypothetical protein
MGAGIDRTRRGLLSQHKLQAVVKDESVREEHELPREGIDECIVHCGTEVEWVETKELGGVSLLEPPLRTH